jgi:hypothetical protein
MKMGYMADVRRKAYGTRLDVFLYWNASYWHMAMQQGWLTPPGSMGSVTAYGDDATRHPKLADECAADKLVSVEYRGDKKQAEWKNTGPNHWGDCLAMCGALLSVLGVYPTGARRKSAGGGVMKRVESVAMDPNAGKDSPDAQPKPKPIDQVKKEVQVPEKKSVLQNNPLRPAFRRVPTWQRW